MRTGVDPNFPWYEAHEGFSFPPPDRADPRGIVCTGGNLSPGLLLSAYSQGIFPWYSSGEPLIWWSPDPRFVLFPQELHVSGTMRKIIKKRRFRLSVDQAFGRVIRACSGVKRPGQRGTWIVPDMVDGYERLHALGYAHSAEAWLDDELVGGLYGVSLGSLFFGESMFSLVPDASKAVFIPLVWRLADEGCTLIDSQVRTDHVAGMGGRDIMRSEYLGILSAGIRHPGFRGNWGSLFPDFPESGPWNALAGGKTANPQE